MHERLQVVVNSPINGEKAMSQTSELANFVAGVRFEHLPAEVVQQAKKVLLDAVGCALGAFRDEPGAPAWRSRARCSLLRNHTLQR